MYNFTQFITWPAAVFPNENAPFVIGILGEDPFNGYLQKIVSGETVNGHKINVKRCRDAGEALDCHLLFIRYENSEQTKKTLAGLHGREMLTVGEDPNFTVMGGILRFFTRDNKIRFEINLPAARDANLDISSKLLRVAEIYPPGRG